MITIINYGMGNLGSIANMFKYIGVESIITDDRAVIKDSKKILLPGVGAFDTAMSKIRESGFEEILNKKALIDKVPVLGICLGMQLLTRGSEEGTLKGLDWIPARTLKFPPEKDLKVPHMGWNSVLMTNLSPLTQDLPVDPRFYFVHSYYVKADNPQDVILTSHHGIDFDAAISHGNIYGAQFHPEKSHKFGMKLFANFAGLPC